jgi:SAM-dependent methyltransferase
MTYQADVCPGCGSSDFIARPVVMSSFIATYVFDRAPDVHGLAACRACGLNFYTTRYDDAEIARLYTDYRSDRYLAIRQRSEPWYTRKVNEDLMGPGMLPRAKVYRETVAGHADTGSIGSVLDYGGDRGQMMSGGPGSDLYIYDISGLSPEPGVTAIRDEDSLERKQFDLVLLCAIVEHFSEPLAQLRRVAERVRPGGLLYIEVPEDSFSVDSIPSGGWYLAYLKQLARHPSLMVAVDFLSTAIRLKFRVVPPFGFAKQHEHLNYFNVRSLSNLVTAAGLTLLDCSMSSEGSVVALCRRPAAIDAPEGADARTEPGSARPDASRELPESVAQYPETL